MNYGMINRPKSQGATRRVWDLADEITSSSGRLARRRDVIDAYVAEGGNANTASTQFHYWKVAREADADVGQSVREQADGLTCTSKRLKIEPDGQLYLPADVLRKLGLGEDGIVLVRVEDGELRVSTPKVVARKMQGFLAHLKAPGESVVDDFLAERRSNWGED